MLRHRRRRLAASATADWCRQTCSVRPALRTCSARSACATQCQGAVGSSAERVHTGCACGAGETPGCSTQALQGGVSESCEASAAQLVTSGTPPKLGGSSRALCASWQHCRSSGCQASAGKSSLSVAALCALCHSVSSAARRCHGHTAQPWSAQRGRACIPYAGYAPARQLPPATGPAVCEKSRDTRALLPHRPLQRPAWRTCRGICCREAPQPHHNTGPHRRQRIPAWRCERGRRAAGQGLPFAAHASAAAPPRRLWAPATAQHAASRAGVPHLRCVRAVCQAPRRPSASAARRPR
jgi:hypothetical protein